MSLTPLDSPVAASSSTDTSSFNPKLQPRLSHQAPTMPAFNGRSAININFDTDGNLAGPMFGDDQRPAERHSNNRHQAHHHQPTIARQTPQQGFMQQLQQWISQWFGGQRPPQPDHCNGAHPGSGASAAGQSPTDYSTKSNEQLGLALLNNFKAFTRSDFFKTLHTSSIAAMALRELGNGSVMDQNILLARELMRHPGVLAAFDRNAGTGALDGWIDKQQLSALIGDVNVFKYKSDKQVAQEMLGHFSQLTSRFGRRGINVRDLRALASENLTGNSSRDHLVQLAQTVLSRSDLLATMDNLASRASDERISKHALEILSR